MSTNTPDSPRDLRQELISAGLELLEEGGVPAVTLRQCAARVGVSHAAPAHHFDGVMDLKAAIVGRGYSMFADCMLNHLASGPQDQLSRVQSIGHGYVHFALTNKALFQFMFLAGNTFPEGSTDAAEAQRARQILADVCAPLDHGDGTAFMTEITVWAAVHGFTEFALFGEVSPNEGDPNYTTWDHVFANLRLKASE